MTDASPSPAFYRFAEELLNSLRLAHPRVAYLARLNSELFRCIKLPVDPKQEVLFRYSIDSWALSEEDVRAVAGEERRCSASAGEARDDSGRCVSGGGMTLMMLMRGTAEAPLGDELFGLAISCVIDAGIRPTALTLQYDTLGDFEWVGSPAVYQNPRCAADKRRILEYLHESTLPDWNQLDLSRTTKVLFQPWSLTPRDRRLDPGELWDDEVNVAAKTGAVLAALQVKCGPSVRDLQIEDGCPHVLPDSSSSSSFANASHSSKNHPPALPELQHLSLGYCTLCAKPFANLLSHSPKLTRLEMRSTRLEGQHSGWKCIFTAIRDHANTNGMALSFDQVITSDYCETSLELQTSEYREREPVLDSDRVEDAGYCLEGYLCGCNEWNEALN
ncbi:Uu.00g134220.m01.CDS01 [Anthostomella pinea]|uniref:Uu.00g134220.m01.CDS01 n=1 Tax=Anthostomella pinea TaxID=933095 RepID=A0AAI8VPU8_9PEZI|nr:Uu.00g134220.m01.CDS01 [Anthostomella pinea]